MRPFLTREQFIQKAKEIHGDKYDYSKVIYLGMYNKIIIICPIHGEFEQIPLSHLQNKGCYACGNKRRINKILISLEEYKTRASFIHKNLYNYDKTILNSTRDKIIIVCSTHGEFTQRADNHLKGQGCPKCHFNKLKELLSSNKDNFIEKAIIVHGNKYRYDDFIYTNNRTKGNIKCNTCNIVFEQSPDSHINQKNGCPSCNDSKGELAIKNILDKYNIKYNQEYIIPEVVSLLKYDFYLPDHRLLIEFHGIQHYEYIPFLHRFNEDNFLKQKERDIIKKDHAYRFKYRFLEFNYKQLKYMTLEQFEEMIIDKINVLAVN